MKTKIIGLKDLRENTESYIAQVGKGKSFVVVKRSKPVFRVTPVDEWGDEGVWETLIDFRKINPHGVPIDEVIKALKESIKKDEQRSKIHRQAK
ncbi:MAG: type II toxin-antitoxin system prevent-host-death family antitoxin [bacterium]|nr:type II toxin-antitoxin system prevent-host-death family antitoxin [bacterium]